MESTVFKAVEEIDTSPQSYERFTSLYSHKLGNTSLFKVACTHYFSQSHTANACLIKYFEFKRKDQSELATLVACIVFTSNRS